MGKTPCASCGHAVPDGARGCPGCGHTVAEVVSAGFDFDPNLAAPREDATPAPAEPPANAPVPPSRPAVTQGELLMVALAVAVGAVITFALLTTRSLSSSEASAAELAAVQPASFVEVDALPAVTRTWSAANRAAWVGTRRNAVAYEVEADTTIGVWMRSVRPALVVRCVAGRTEVFVFTDSAARIEPETDDHTVTFRFDDGEAVTERWPDSADHDALFAPDGAAFARRLARARSMRFGFTPHNAPSAAVSFQVAGLDEVLAPAARECGWTR